jgi:hypothetical protein
VQRGRTAKGKAELGAGPTLADHSEGKSNQPDEE